jgi:hypothetical protein
VAGLTGFFVISIMLSLLIFIGEATRRLRSAKDVRMSKAQRNTAQPRVRDLSVAFRRAANVQTRSTASPSTSSEGRDGGAGGRIRVRQVGLALSVLKLLPYPAASIPSGEILFKGEDLLWQRRRTTCAGCAATTSP